MLSSLLGFAQGLLAQGTLTDGLITGAGTGTVLTGVILLLHKSSEKRNAEHREDWSRVNQERREDMRSYAEMTNKAFTRMVDALENNTQAFTKLDERVSRCPQNNGTSKPPGA
jgi:ligand-binding sensor protein